jgi:transglutaminase-like putative cysteine protease
MTPTEASRTLRIVHETRYHYASGVDTAQHVAHLQPPHTACQTVQQFALTIAPEGAQVRMNIDAFGNHRSYFALPGLHHSLLVTAHSAVSTRCLPPATSRMRWEEVRAFFGYKAGAPGNTAAGFVFGSHYAPVNEVFAQYARTSFTPQRPLQLAAQDLMHRIHADFIYESRSTDISTPAAQVLEQKRGVCQDFAHIMIACLRSMGVAARYVSGYLLTHPAEGQERLIGADASHAWVSVYVPDVAQIDHASGGWLDLDPTNDQCGWASPGTDYVRLAIGRDFADVSPLRGVLLGGATHTMEVGVTVEPFVLPS